MAQSFQVVRDGYRARMIPDELTLLRQVFSDLAGMLADRAPADDETPQWARELGLTELSGQAPPGVPDDPAVARLLPAGRTDDDEAAAEFRRFTEPGLRARKQRALNACCELFASWLAEPTGDQRFDAGQAHQFLTALTDARLVLAERLGVRTDEDATNLHESLEALAEQSGELGEREQERIWMASVYEFLAWLQESLVTAMSQTLPPPDRRRIPPGGPSE